MKVPHIRNGTRGISTLHCDETHLAYLLPIPTPSRTAPTCRIRGTCAAFSGLLNMSIRFIQRLLSASSKSERFVQSFQHHPALSPISKLTVYIFPLILSSQHRITSVQIGFSRCMYCYDSTRTAGLAFVFPAFRLFVEQAEWWMYKSGMFKW